MKKSKFISLVLITAVLASCGQSQREIKAKEQKVYMRADSTAPYQQAHTHRYTHGSSFLWFYAFHAFGSYRNGSFARSGYYSSGLGSRANTGANYAKSSVIRGGFGHTSSHVSS